MRQFFETKRLHVPLRSPVIKCAFQLKHVAFIGIHAPCFISLLEPCLYRKTGAHFCATRFSNSPQFFDAFHVLQEGQDFADFIDELSG